MTKPVLIVDDNPNMSSLLVEMLEALDYKAVVANDGNEALQKIAEQDFSLVITDFRMPNMTGIELLEKIKAHRADLPVAIISGYSISPARQSDASRNDEYIATGLIVAFDTRSPRMGEK